MCNPERVAAAVYATGSFNRPPAFTSIGPSPTLPQTIQPRLRADKQKSPEWTCTFHREILWEAAFTSQTYFSFDRSAKYSSREIAAVLRLLRMMKTELK